MNEKPGNCVTFHVAKDFWSSSLLDNTAGSVAVTAPATGLAQAVAQHRANVLIMDVEGAEHAILTRSDLTGVETI
ncbi:MAG: hypothetical protein AAGB46_16625, partial [Verrucomicrobiota bacterium]